MTAESDFIVLYTWQYPEWDIRFEKRNPEIAIQSWSDTGLKFKPAYDKLEKELGTQGIVWCYQNFKYWDQMEIRRLWKLKVPRARILCYMDNEVWQKCLEEDPGKYWYKLFTDNPENDKHSAIIQSPIPESWVCSNIFHYSCWQAGRNMKENDLPITTAKALKLLLIKYNKEQKQC